METIKVKVIATPSQLENMEVDPFISGEVLEAWDWGFKSPEFGLSAKVAESYDEADYWTIPINYLEKIENYENKD